MTTDKVQIRDFGDPGCKTCEAVGAIIVERLTDTIAMVCPDCVMPKLQSAVEAATWKARAEALWQLLDDIDTLDDMVKSNEVAYRQQVRKTHQLRFAYAGSNGYMLDWKPLEEAQKIVGPGGRWPTSNELERETVEIHDVARGDDGE